MSENYKPEIKKSSELSERVIDVVKDPQKYLKNNFSKGCRASIDFLINVRSELRRDASYSIPGPHPDFKMFYASNDDDVGFYKGLVKLLKDAGHTEAAIRESFFDFLTDHAIQRTSIKDNLSTFNALFDEAVQENFGHK